MNQSPDNERKGLRDLSRDSGEVAKYYDDWAGEYDDTLARWRYEAPIQAANRLRDLVGPDSAVLDAGCGTGLSGAALSEAGFTTIDGIDVSRRSLDIARELGVYRSLELVDMQTLPLPLEADSYDGLVCVGVLTYLPDSEATLAEFCRVVRPGGGLVLTQRSDILAERDFPAVLDALVQRGLMSEPEISDPCPYLPDNDEFGDEIRVHYITGRAS